MLTIIFRTTLSDITVGDKVIAKSIFYINMFFGHSCSYPVILVKGAFAG
jgi:hypothetical protein